MDVVAERQSITCEACIITSGLFKNIPQTLLQQGLWALTLKNENIHGTRFCDLAQIGLIHQMKY